MHRVLQKVMREVRARKSGSFECAGESLPHRNVRAMRSFILKKCDEKNACTIPLCVLRSSENNSVRVANKEVLQKVHKYGAPLPYTFFFVFASVFFLVSFKYKEIVRLITAPGSIVTCQ